MYIIIKLLSYYYYFIIIFFPHERRGLHDPILVLINSISSSSYADDTAITFTADNNIELTTLIKKTLIKIEKWYKYNKLKLNISKTEMINFNSNKYPNNIISLNDTLINKVYNYKYLGIILDSKLDFKNHIIKLNNKLS